MGLRLQRPLSGVQPGDRTGVLGRCRSAAGRRLRRMDLGLVSHPWARFGGETYRLVALCAALRQGRAYQTAWTDTRDRHPVAYTVRIEPASPPGRVTAVCQVRVLADAPVPLVGHVRDDLAGLSQEQQLRRLHYALAAAWEGAYRVWRTRVVVAAPAAAVFRVDAYDHYHGRTQVGRYTLPRPDLAPAAPAPPLVGQWGWTDLSPAARHAGRRRVTPDADDPFAAPHRARGEAWAADFLGGQTGPTTAIAGFHLAALTPRPGRAAVTHDRAPPARPDATPAWCGRAWF